MRWFLTFAWLLLSAAAFGQSIEGGGGLVVTPPIFVPQSASYSGPGDVVSGAKFWYGLRAYSNTLANAGASTTKVIDVLGATTVTGCTIFLLGNGTGGLDLTTAGAGGVGNQCLLGATTFCTSTNTSCTVSKFYDQTAGMNCTGSACDVIQATAADQPILTFSAIGGNAAITCVTANSQYLKSSPSFANASTSYTMSAVVEFTGSGQSAYFSAGNNAPQTGAGIAGGDYFMYAGAVAEATGAASVVHAVQAVFDGGSGNDAFYIDGSGTTGLSAGGASWSAAIDVCIDSPGGHPWGGLLGEAGYWATNFSAGQQSSMNSNQHSYWGF